MFIAKIGGNWDEYRGFDWNKLTYNIKIQFDCGFKIGYYYIGDINLITKYLTT
jgi:hypothetical protein